MSKKIFAALFLVSIAGLTFACGGAEVGEACETEGAEDECVDGAICGHRSTSDSTPQCLKVCTSDTDCASDEACNGVTGSSTKACRVK